MADPTAVVAMPPRSVLLAVLGPWMMGCLAVFWGSGFLFAELLLYIHRFYNLDPPLIKALVFALWATNLVQDLQAGGVAVDMFASHYGNLGYFAKGTWLSLSVPPVTSTVILISHVFFCHRSFKCIGSLKLRRLFLVVVAPLVLCSFAAGISVGVASAKPLEGNATINSNIRTPLIVWFSSMLATDFLITSVLLFFLHLQIRDTVDTQTLVEKLLILTIESMLPPSLCVLAALITFLCVPSTTVYVFLLGIQGKLYSISLLHTLNGRWRLRKKLSETKVLPAAASTFGTSGKVKFSRCPMRSKAQSQRAEPLTSILSLNQSAYPMDCPSNWRGDQDIVDLESWRRAGLGEFEEEKKVGEDETRVLLGSSSRDGMV